MSSLWHYRVHGRDVGPVDFATLRVMSQEERLFVDDEIRSEDSDLWVAAETVPGLFPESADADDLLSMLAAADTPAAQEDRENWRDACFCRTRSEELGPMSYDTLIGLVRAGRLAQRDQVRLGTSGEWIEARSVAGLIADPDQATIDASSLLDDIEIVADPTPRRPRVPRAAPEPALRMVDDIGDPGDDVNIVGAPDVAVADVAAQWHCRVLGQDIGPVDWNDMRALAETRQLGPNDRVRKGQSVAWVPAGTINGLFPKRSKRPKQKLSDDDVFGILQPPEPEVQITSHMAPQRSFERPSRKPAPEVVERVAPASGATRPSGAAAVAPAARPEPRAAAPAPPPRPVFTPPRPAPRAKRRMGNPFSSVGAGLGGMFSSMEGGLKGSWKPIAAVAAVLVVVAAVYAVGIPGLGGTAGKGYYVETKTMWEQAQKIKQSGSADEWSKFKTATLPRVKELHLELDPLATADQRLLQLMLFCHRDCLPVMLEGTLDQHKPVWNEMAGYMKEAEQIYTTK